MRFLLCLVVVMLSGCSTEKPASQSNAEERSAEPDMYAASPAPVVPESEFLNTRAGVGYVGSESCQECHADVHAHFSKTRHSRSMAEARGQVTSPAEVPHPLSGYSYSSRTGDDGELLHTESLLVGKKELAPRDILIRWAVGSGRFGRSYLAEMDGFLVQSPLTWYSDRQQWGMSPGYDFPTQFSFRRNVAAGCLYCHAGPVESIGDNDYHVQVHESFISCERCHGPGELHVQKHSSVAGGSKDDVDYSIVNPAHLDRELQEAICQQCHLQADAQVMVRGHDFDDYRPGLPLSAFRRDFRFGAADDQMTIVGHVAQMHRSACFTETDSLTCTTCHHPHQDQSDTAPLDQYRAICLTCHQDEDCGEVPLVRTQKAENHCTKCHMPSAPTEVPHVAFTHHRIGIHETDDDSAAAPARGQILSMLEPASLPRADQARVSGLAALSIYQTRPQSRDERLLRGARELLQEAWDKGAGDVDVAAGLANIAEITRFDPMIEKWGTIALDLDDSPSEGRATALQVVSELRFRQQRFEESYELLRELTAIRRDPRAWFYRGLVAQNLDQTEDAIASLERAVEINPRNASAHSILATLYELLENSDKSDYHRQMANELQK
ncbi:MAG: tetratricopeptide repeat protein [Planctomycetaceae bacterium]|nr:tetratricopeptide repeat protein [Planctomycetaceae bacterium]